MPLLQQFNAPGDIRIALWEIIEPEEVLYALLPDDNRNYKQQSSRLATSKRRIEFMVVRLLADAVLGQNKEIAYTPGGAPYLTDHSFRISITHTAGYAGIALHATLKVGIDVERIGPKVVRVKEKFLSDSELHYLQDEPMTCATVLWCAKESMFKALDSSAIDFRAHLNILPFELKKTGMLQAQETHSDRQQYFDIYYHIWPDFALTYCKSDI